MKISNKVALITGGSRGIGKAIAIKFAEEGAKLVLCAKSVNQLEQTADKIRGQIPSAEVLTVPADLSKLADIEQLFSAALKKFNQVDILVNNAGIAGPNKSVVEMTPAEWEETININLTGTFFCSKLAFEHMIKDGIQGNIINISSVAGKKGGGYASAYSASKAAVNSLTESLAAEGGPFNIHCNTICPGAIETEMFQSAIEDHAKNIGLPDVELIRNHLLQAGALKRFATAEEVANTALFLAAEESSGITGEIFTVSAGAATY